MFPSETMQPKMKYSKSYIYTKLVQYSSNLYHCAVLGSECIHFTTQEDID